MPVVKYKSGYKVANTMGTKSMSKQQAAKQLRAIKASKKKRGK